jgi:hypothetical protein
MRRGGAQRRSPQLLAVPSSASVPNAVDRCLDYASLVRRRGSIDVLAHCLDDASQIESQKLLAAGCLA